MKKLILILSLICLSTYSQDKQEKLDSTLEEIKSCLQFVEKKKVKKSNSRKYEYIKDFKTEGWACIEKGINSQVLLLSREISEKFTESKYPKKRPFYNV